MAESVTFTTGDEVRVFYWATSKRRQHPHGFPGRVTRTAKRYGWALFVDERGREGEVRFDMTTGYQSPDVDGFAVKTLAQADDAVRRKEALGVLHAGGLEIKLGYGDVIRTNQLEELAAVVAAWGDP